MTVKSCLPHPEELSALKMAALLRFERLGAKEQCWKLHRKPAREIAQKSKCSSVRQVVRTLAWNAGPTIVCL